MFKRVVLIPYKMGSASCRNLAEELRKHVPTLRIRPERYALRQKQHDFVIGWGSLNSIASNKLKFFNAASKVEGLNIPEYTTDPAIAGQWHQEGIDVVGRRLLSSHSGNGIIMITKESERVEPCPLYVKYIKKTLEYRVHVFANQVIDIVQKKRRAASENVNSQIRNHANGWVFCREDIKINNKNDLSNQALLACNAAGLDFGAVDIVYNAKQKKYYVLEVNTAPGLEGQTITNYSNAILNYIKAN